MAKLTIQLEGGPQLERELRELDDRLHRPLDPLLDVIGQQVARWAQNRIRESGADLRGTPLAWPPLHPATRAIRRRYGHDGKPDLFRGGQLLHDIRPLGRGPDHVDVGATLEYAADVQRGGTVTRGGRRREVPARPFLAITDLQADDLAEMVGAYFAAEEGAPGV